MRLNGIFLLPLLGLFFIFEVKAAQSCGATSSLSFYEKYEQADAIFSGEAQSVDKLEPPQGELDRVATVKVKKVWKGNVDGLIKVLYKDHGKRCARGGYIDSPNSGIKIYFVKNSGSHYTTSFEMGTYRERSITSRGEVAALDFISKKKVSPAEYEAFKEKNRQKFKTFR